MHGSDPDRVRELTGTIVFPGEAEGRLLVLREPISFWGGVDPVTGAVADPRHPNHGEKLCSRIVVMDRTIGSSSSSAIMLELLRNGTAAAGIVAGEPDAILVLGILVAEELGYPTVPFLRVGTEAAASLASANGHPATLRAPAWSAEQRRKSTERPEAGILRITG